MSEGIQRAAGVQLRSILQTFTKNKIVGTTTGFLVTAAVQSSSATTVMMVSFVNAGLFTIAQSVGIIIGANIGTTITSWLVTVLGFKVKLDLIAIPLCAIAVPMLFFERGRTKYWGEFLVGFAILFIGLGFLKSSVPDFSTNPESLNFLAELTNFGFLSVIIFVFIGIILTIVVQSSSASITLILVICLNGWVNYEMGAALILGANMGTTLTAEIAALVGNHFARYAARVHTVFNILGVVIFILFFPVFLQFSNWIGQSFFGNFDAYLNADAIPLTLSIFHTSFNAINAVIWLFLTPLLLRIASWTISGKTLEHKVDRLDLMNSPVAYNELSMVEVQFDVKKLGETVLEMHGDTVRLMKSTDENEIYALLQHIEQLEQETDRKNEILVSYIGKMMSAEVTKKTMEGFKAMLLICNDLERTADLYAQIANTIRLKQSQRIWFEQYHRDSINEILSPCETLLKNILTKLEKRVNTIPHAATKEIYTAISNRRTKLKDEYLTFSGGDNMSVQRSLIFSNICDYIDSISKMLFTINQTLDVQK